MKDIKFFSFVFFLPFFLQIQTIKKENSSFPRIWYEIHSASSNITKKKLLWNFQRNHSSTGVRSFSFCLLLFHFHFLCSSFTCVRMMIISMTSWELLFFVFSSSHDTSKNLKMKYSRKNNLLKFVSFRCFRNWNHKFRWEFFLRN